jgi:biopolymer transport protein ExbB
MRYLILTILIITNIFAFSSEQIFDKLLQKVKEGYKEQTLEDKNREQKFLDDMKNQQKMVNDIKNEIKKAKTLSKKLKSSIKSNEVELQKLANDLELATGDLGELFGTVKQFSSDMNVDIKESLVSAQYPKRDKFLQDLSTKNELPNIKELEKLWFIMFQEIVESGKVVKFSTQIIKKEGSKSFEDVIRVGNFSATTQDSFLKYSSNNSIFIEPSSQPNSSISTIKEFFNSNSNISETVIDPTRGTILDLVAQKPTIKERISQGGNIGYIIIGLGVLGLIFAIFKYIWLSYISFRVNSQLKNISKVNSKNPLGRVISAYESNKSMNLSDLEYRVDEAFYKEIPPLQSGLSMIKLFAATAPLLGLLGTVTGMIVTFQAITLFGTSDPRLMAEGISQALITTMLGLIVAIPLLFAHTILSSKAKKIITTLEQSATSLIANKIDRDD